MKLLYRVVDVNNELYKGDKNQVTSWLGNRSDNSGLIVVKVGGSLEYTVDEFLSNIVPLTMKYSIVQDFGIDSEMLFSSNSKDRIIEWLKAQSDVRGMMVVNTDSPIGDRTKTVEDFLRQNIIPEIFSQFAPKFYKMNPKTDDLLPSGNHLANGMKVLIADSSQRVKIDMKLTDWQEDRALENNRWCTVGALEVSDSAIRFIGVYEDGSKRMRVATPNEAWLVKIDSIRESVNLHTEKFAIVRELVSEAVKFGSEFEARIRIEGCGSTGELNRGIDETTKKIMGLL